MLLMCTQKPFSQRLHHQPGWSYRHCSGRCGDTAASLCRHGASACHHSISVQPVESLWDAGHLITQRGHELVINAVSHSRRSLPVYFHGEPSCNHCATCCSYGR